MVCLLLDIAQRFNRSIFGINIAYCSDGNLRIRTIGMHTLKCSQTGRNLFQLVKNILSEHNISLDQVFSVTTDNGKNLIKMNKFIQKELYENTCSSDESDEDEEADCNVFDNNWTDESILDPDIFNNEYFEDLLSNLRDEFDCQYKGVFTGISCAVHGIHLVVQGAIKNSNLSHLIEKCRTLAKKLRTPKLRGELSKCGQKMALRDVPTRWSSLFNMVRFN